MLSEPHHRIPHHLTQPTVKHITLLAQQTHSPRHLLLLAYFSHQINYSGIP